MSTATVADAARVALQALAVAAITDPNGRVTFGRGYPVQSTDDMVLVMGVRAKQEWRRTGRTRNEAGEIELHILTWRVGGDDQARADLAAFAYLNVIETRCRTVTPNELTPTVVEDFQLTSVEASGTTSVEGRAAGAGCELVATFTYRAVITG